MIRTSTFCIFLALLLASCGSAHKELTSWQKESLIMAKPESRGFSSEGLKGIDILFQDYVDQNKIAGATALVARKGKIVYYKSTGYDDLEKQIPLEKDAIFRIASQTKAVTSVAIMMFSEEGRIALNDPVSMYLPEFSNPQLVSEFNTQDSSYTTKAAKREVTIHDLLTHTAGYSYPGNGNEVIHAIYAKQNVVNGVPDKNTNLKDEMQIIATVPLMYQPGEQFSYGLSTDILGYLVEVLSGQSLEDFFRTRIFNPLGMEDSYFHLPVNKQSRLMNLYQDNAAGNGIMKATGEYVDYPKQKGLFYSGGGGLSSTTMDYAIFQQMLLNEGQYKGKRLLEPKTIEMMRSNQIGNVKAASLFIPGHMDKFGLGFEVISPPESTKGSISDGSFGWGGAFGSLYWIDPEENLIVHLVIQKTGSYTELRSDFITTVYSALER